MRHASHITILKYYLADRINIIYTIIIIPTKWIFEHFIYIIKKATPRDNTFALQKKTIQYIDKYMNFAVTKRVMITCYKTYVLNNFNDTISKFNNLR